MTWIETKIASRRDWATGLMSLTLEATASPFVPGQFINLGLDREGNRIKQVPVKLGERSGDFVQLVEGPPVGSLVLTVGSSFTLDGDVIQPVEAGTAQATAAPGAK